MMIHEMSREECLRVLAGARLARLACAYENQPYIVPAYFAYHAPPGGDACLYGFTTAGQKVEWMRANPLVCVEVDEFVSFDQWVSVIAFGRYEELPDVPGRNRERLLAHELLQQARAMWWETAGAVRNRHEPSIPIFYVVRINQVTGRKAISSAVPAPPERKLNWMRRLLRRLCGGSSK